MTAICRWAIIAAFASWWAIAPVRAGDPEPEAATPEKLVPAMKKARAELTLLMRKPPPQSVTPDLLKALQAKRVAYNLQTDNVGLWEAAARPDDFAKVGPQGYAVAEQISRGFIALQYPPAGGRLPKPSAALEKKAQAVTLGENAEPEELSREADAIHKRGKRFVAAPTGARLESWGDDKVGKLATHCDVLVIQSERWFVEDKTEAKKEWIAMVTRWTKVIRQANPTCQIFIEVGRRLDRGGGTAADWLTGFALLLQHDAGSFDGMYFFITRQKTDDPNQGPGALRQTLAWLRPIAGDK